MSIARQSAVAARCQAGGARVVPAAALSRRGLLYATGMALWMGGAASQAQAKDLEEARKEKEARKKQLREAAGDMKTTGRDENVFAVPEYSVSEEARTPNFHSRQGEGAKTQKNM